MANVLLGVTGSVAALKTLDLVKLLRQAGHTVRVVATDAALYFFDPGAVSGTAERDPNVVTIDADEWPGREQGRRYDREDQVLHIELRRWARAFVIAPLDANTLGKLALGLCDNCLTCVWRAWDHTHPVILAPAMNTLMWEHPATARHLRQIAEDWGIALERADALTTCAQINRAGGRLHLVPPISKTLACDDVGMGALALLPDIVARVETALPSVA